MSCGVAGRECLEDVVFCGMCSFMAECLEDVYLRGKIRTEIGCHLDLTWGRMSYGVVLERCYGGTGVECLVNVARMSRC